VRTQTPDSCAPLGRSKLSTFAMFAACLTVAAFIGTPHAHATTEAYLDEVRATVRYPLTDQQALRLGNIACQAMRAGIEQGLAFGKARHQADQAVGYAQRQLGLSLTMADGMLLVQAAEHQLC
jgi:hypothetical protein